jgi:hypothetical protein
MREDGEAPERMRRGESCRAPVIGRNDEQSNTRKTKNQLEADLIKKAKEKTKNATDLQVLQATFARLR